MSHLPLTSVCCPMSDVQLGAPSSDSPMKAPDNRTQFEHPYGDIDGDVSHLQTPFQHFSNGIIRPNHNANSAEYSKWLEERGGMLQ